MTLWQRWLEQPQRIWLRRAIFQIHLWSGLGLGLYVFAICVSGSALVFRNELADASLHGPTIVQQTGTRLSDDALKQAAVRAYPDATVTDVWPAKQPNYAVEVWLNRRGSRLEELFDPYTGQDLGASEPAVIRWLVWLAALHDELLHGETGEKVNGIGGLLLVMICLTGAVIWWPGIGTWRRSMAIEWKANWKRLNWTLHSAIGFWAFLIVFMFAFTGFYLVFQDPFNAVVNYFEPIRGPFVGRRPLRTGDLILRWLARLHFGRYGGWKMESAWVVMGLIPPTLFVTGTLMWWNRVLWPALRRSKRPLQSAETLTASRTSS